MAVTFKKDKLQGRLLKEINIILRNLSDKRLQFVSVTKVELNHDNSNAVVYWDTFDASKRGDAKAAIGNMAGKIRSLLAGKIQLRHMPGLTFLYDSQYESEQVIEKILNSEKNKGKFGVSSSDEE